MILILKYMYVYLFVFDLNELLDFFYVFVLYSESDGDCWVLFIGVG